MDARKERGGGEMTDSLLPAPQYSERLAPLWSPRVSMLSLLIKGNVNTNKTPIVQDREETLEGDSRDTGVERAGQSPSWATMRTLQAAPGGRQNLGRENLGGRV